LIFGLKKNVDGSLQMEIRRQNTNCIFIGNQKPKIMKVSEEMMYLRCMTIESMVREMVMKGTTDNELLVTVVDNLFPPDTDEEMEKYSEAIIYAKYGVLN
jgi:type II restriction/modification system DNA methylase subunit YeeA